MATDATGTPTSPDNLPTYNTAVDAPTGKGFNAAMALVQTALSLRAPLASPTLTGTPLAPMPATNDNSTQISTTAFVKAQNYITSAGVPVTAVFGRTGAVVAAANDYTLVQVGTGTNHSLAISGATVMGSLATGSAGQVLRSGGASADPAWSTATYPATAGTAANVLRSDGTNFLSAALAAADVTNAADKSSGTAQTFTGALVAPSVIVSGITGSTAASRYVGATASGAPVSGAHLLGDWAIDQTGKIYICTTAGTPGTWTAVGTASGVTTVFGRSGVVVATSGDYTAAQVTNAADTASASPQIFTGNVQSPAHIAAGLTGATSSSRYVGATTGGAPTTGTFAVGDYVVDQTGKIWTCIVAGTPGTWLVNGWGSAFQLTNLNAGVMSTIFSQSIPGNFIGPNGSLDIRVHGDFQNSSGSAATISSQIQYGATTLWGSAATTTLSSAAAHRPVRIISLLSNEGSVSSQRVTGEFVVASGNAGSIAGQGDLTTATLIGPFSFMGTSAINSATAQTLIIGFKATFLTDFSGSVHILWRP